MTLEKPSSCPQCGNPTYPDGSFCGSCGVRLIHPGIEDGSHPNQMTHASLVVGVSAGACSSCGEPLLANEKFCVACGMSRIGAAASAPQTTAAWDRVLDRLRAATAGEFEILGELGRGGMAAVYHAYEPALQRQVAIKVMSPGLLLDSTMVERFRREATVVAGLRHPNIVAIYAVRQAEDLHYFVMEYLRGLSLDQLQRARGSLPVPLARAVLFQVASALQYAHRRGVVHRDVKPGNVMINDSGDAIVTDFGIAKVSEADSYTQTGISIGTPAYMSPEQCRGEALTGASDQYSLGIVAFEMLTGSVPFKGPAYEVQSAHVQRPAPLVTALRPDVPVALAQAIARMLAKQPGDRWPTVTDAADAAGASPVSETDPVRQQLADLVSAAVSPNVSPNVAPPLASHVASRVAPHVAPNAVPQSPVLIPQSPIPNPQSPIPTVAGNFAPSPGTASLRTLVLESAPLPGSSDARGGVGREARPRWRPAALGIVAVVLAIGAGAWLIGQGPESTPIPGPPARSPADSAPVPVVQTVSPQPANPLRTIPAPNVAVRRDTVRLEIVGQPDSLPIGGVAQLKVIGRDRRGSRLAVTPSWSSLNPDRLSVDSRGNIAGRAPGTATIRVRSGAAAATTNVVVVGPTVSKSAETTAPPAVPPQPAPVSTVPPQPAPVSTSPSSTEATAATIRRVLTGYVGLLRARKVDDITARFEAVSEADRRNLRNLQNLLRTSENGTRVVEELYDSVGQVQGARAAASFRVRFAWTNAFGMRRQEWVRFEAELERQDGDNWRIRRCRIVGTPGIG